MFPLLLSLELPSVAQAEEPPVEVTLSDGQTLVGQVTRNPDGSVLLVLADGRELLLPAEVVARVADATDTRGPAPRWGPDPNRSRYLYSPAAFNVGQGRGYLAQRALVLTSAAVGVTDWLDVEVGSVLPLLFTESPVAVVGLKGTLPVVDTLRLGAGAQALVIPIDDLQLLGFAFGTITYGTQDDHVSLAGGPALDFRTGEVGVGVVTLSGNHRLGPRSALITENWFVWLPEGSGPWGGPLFVVPSGGVRLFGPSFAVDLALVPVITGEDGFPVLPLPWVSVAWNWSLKKGDRAPGPPDSRSSRAGRGAAFGSPNGTPTP